MKKILYILICGLFLLSIPAKSQVFEGKGDLSVNAGISLGVIGHGYGYYGNAGFAIPLTLNVDYGVHEMFSVGPYLGYMNRSYGPSGSRYSFTSFAFGAQGVFHATPFLNEHLDFGADENKIDYYAKLIVGYEAYTWRINGESYNGYYNDSGGPIFSPVIGVRYMFNPSVGGFAEAGRGAFGWLTLGVSLKL